MYLFYLKFVLYVRCGFLTAVSALYVLKFSAFSSSSSSRTNDSLSTNKLYVTKNVAIWIKYQQMLLRW